MSNTQSYEHEEQDYGFQAFRPARRPRTSSSSRPTMGRKRGKSPQSFNGMHRRRKRKMSW